jgi:hypothetical protein
MRGRCGGPVVWHIALLQLAYDSSTCAQGSAVVLVAFTLWVLGGLRVRRCSGGEQRQTKTFASRCYAQSAQTDDGGERTGHTERHGGQTGARSRKPGGSARMPVLRSTWPLLV